MGLMGNLMKNNHSPINREYREYWKNVILTKYHFTPIHYTIWKRIFLSNPNLYTIIEGAILYPNCFDIEILTFSPEYEKIWECLKKDYEYPIVTLNEMGYDENLCCYVVDVNSLNILEFIKWVHRHWNENPRNKKNWIEKYG